MKNKDLKSIIVLVIDSSSNQEIKVGLKINEKEYWITKKHKRAQELLIIIDRLLKQKKLKLEQISEIEVNTGPGSFTGLRIGASVANALGFALKVPVNGKHGQVQPEYQK